MCNTRHKIKQRQPLWSPNKFLDGQRVANKKIAIIIAEFGQHRPISEIGM